MNPRTKTRKLILKFLADPLPEDKERTEEAAARPAPGAPAPERKKEEPQTRPINSSTTPSRP